MFRNLITYFLAESIISIPLATFQNYWRLSISTLLCWLREPQCFIQLQAYVSASSYIKILLFLQILQAYSELVRLAKLILFDFSLKNL